MLADVFDRSAREHLPHDQRRGRVRHLVSWALILLALLLAAELPPGFTYESPLPLAVAASWIAAAFGTMLVWTSVIPGAFIWGVLAFVTNFIPNIGFVIGVIPPALIGLLEGGPGLMLAVIVVYSAVNVVIQSVIQPRYVGNAVGLSTTLTFLSLVFWTWVLGPLGAILAIPMSLFFKAILVEADPQARWMEPLISGHPRDEPVVKPR